MNDSPRNNYTDGRTAEFKPGDHGTILLVDDEPMVRAMTGAVLSAVGWTVLHAGSGEEALQILEDAERDGKLVKLVILDLILPCGMSGLEAVTQLRKIQPDVRILACSGFFAEDSGDSCLAMGFNGTLSKPFTADDLLCSVNSCVNGVEAASRQPVAA
jgi:CheY-like chemotaxis protein